MDEMVIGYVHKGCHRWSSLSSMSSMIIDSDGIAIRYDAVLVNLPGHLAVRISGGDDYSDTYYNYDGKRYYYCETTGAGWTMGEMPSNFTGESATIIPVQ